jgi:hypothetical protein
MSTTPAPRVTSLVANRIPVILLLKGATDTTDGEVFQLPFRVVNLNDNNLPTQDDVTITHPAFGNIPVLGNPRPYKVNGAIVALRILGQPGKKNPVVAADIKGDTGEDDFLLLDGSDITITITTFDPPSYNVQAIVAD